MNKVQLIHNERKEHWRKLIEQCDASGKTQQEWCQENHVCMGSLSKWRRTIWREEEAWKELGRIHEANQETAMESEQKLPSEKQPEENSFVEVSADLCSGSGEAAVEVVEVAIPKERSITGSKRKEANRTKVSQYVTEAPSLMRPDAVIGYRDYMVGVYEHTSSQVLQKVMEVLQHAS